MPAATNKTADHPRYPSGPSVWRAQPESVVPGQQMAACVGHALEPHHHGDPVLVGVGEAQEEVHRGAGGASITPNTSSAAPASRRLQALHERARDGAARSLALYESTQCDLGEIAVGSRDRAAGRRSILASRLTLHGCAAIPVPKVTVRRPTRPKPLMPARNSVPSFSLREQRSCPWRRAPRVRAARVQRSRWRCHDDTPSPGLRRSRRRLGALSWPPGAAGHPRRAPPRTPHPGS
jgi:hypothetical protein